MSDDLKKVASMVVEELKLGQKEFMNTKEASKYLGISIHTLYKLTREKAIPYFKPGGCMNFFRKADLDSWVTKNRIAPNAELQSKAMAR